MSAARPIAVVAPQAEARRPAPSGGAAAPALARRLAAGLGNEWLPRLAWTIGRTGRAGLLGIALLLAAVVFLLSTHLQVAGEARALRADLEAARRPGRAAVADPGTGPVARRTLPTRAEVPAMLRQLFDEAARAHLAIDTGKYEIGAARGSGVVRYRIAFPVTGPYQQIRSFIDSALARMPALALSDLALERKSIADGEVEAQVRMTVYTAATGEGDPPAATEAEPAGARPLAASPRRTPDRVVAPTHAAALFAQHSWLVLPPAPKPAPPPPPPEPTAPPFPYTFLGSYAPEGRPPVFFLARGDRVIDAHVGDRLDGVYQLESAGGGQLVFVYLPLNVRQTLAAGVSR